MTETTGLGRIEKADLREAWPHEAADSLPGSRTMYRNWAPPWGWNSNWKSEEAPVGKFSLDLLARDTGTNRPVIIENQLESTDHDHLGKLLTYAGGYDAKRPTSVRRLAARGRRFHSLARGPCIGTGRRPSSGLELELVNPRKRRSGNSHWTCWLATPEPTARSSSRTNWSRRADHDHLGKLLTYAGGYDATAT